MVDISIVVPAYNVESYIERCIGSIEKQTFSNYEVLLIDDGSTDSTGLICDNLQEKYSNIRVYHKNNGGLSDARNFGIKQSFSEYIVFIDSDDFLHKDYLKQLHSAMEMSKADIAVCSFKCCFDNEDVTMEDCNGLKITEYDSIAALKALILEDKMMNYAWNKMYRRELFCDIKYPTGKKWEDIGTTYKLFAKSKKIVFINDKLYFYVQRKGSITSTITLTGCLDQYEQLLERYEDVGRLDKTLSKKTLEQTCLEAYSCWSLFNKDRHSYEKDKDLKERFERSQHFLKKNISKAMKHWKGSFKDYFKLFVYRIGKDLLKIKIKSKD